jgi:hypothetical protein
VVALRATDPDRAWTQGRFGRGLELGGGPMGAYLVVDSSPTLISARTDVSVAAWILVPPDTSEGVIVSQRATGTGGYLFSMRVVKNRLNALINSASGYHGDVSSAAVLTKGAWVHVAMTFDSHELRLYVNGKPAASGPYLMAIPPDPSSIVFGGAETENSNAQAANVVSRLAARLDELVLYDRALSPTEVSQLADGVRPRVVMGPL